MEDEKLQPQPEEASVPETVEEENLPATVDTSAGLLNKLMETTDPAEIDQMDPLFQSFFKKRDIIQKHAEYDLKDKLLEKMMERLEKTPNNFDNSDLAVWMKTIQQTIDSTAKKAEAQPPAITYQQNNQVHVNIADTLSRDSRTRITDAIQQILQSVQNESESGVCLDEPLDESEATTEQIISEETDNGNNEEN